MLPAIVDDQGNLIDGADVRDAMAAGKEAELRESIANPKPVSESDATKCKKPPELPPILTANEFCHKHSTLREPIIEELVRGGETANLSCLRGRNFTLDKFPAFLAADLAVRKRELIIVDAFNRTLPESISKNDNASALM